MPGPSGGKTWLSANEIKEVFGVHPTTLKKSKVLTRLNAKKQTEYSLSSLWIELGEAISEKARSGSDDKPAKLADQKLTEEIIRLQIKNKVELDELLPAGDVLELLSECFAIVKDKCERIPQLVAQERQDIDPGILVLIKSHLDDAMREMKETADDREF